MLSRAPTDRPRTIPLRSVVFVPGSDEKQVREAPSLGADAVVLDIEEPQTPMTSAVRERARGLVRELVGSLSKAPLERPVYFARVQPAASGEMLRDLQAVLVPALAGILVPKIRGPDDVVAADALLANVEPLVGLPAGSRLLYPILETAEAIRLAYEIAMASPRVAYMGGAISRFGDIHQALGFRWTREGRETLWIRSKVLGDAKAAGIRYPISGMWGGELDDLAGLRAFATELRQLGYYGMMLGNAVHVPAVHEVFTPTREEVSYWKELVELADGAARRGGEPVLHGSPRQGEGHVVHLAHVGSARLNLEWARDLGLG